MLLIVEKEDLRCESSEIVKLPEPRYTSGVSIEQALLERRSVRVYKDGPVSLEDISQLLWACQGITDTRGYRTTPSAGALYPLEIYLYAANITALKPGIYKYNPQGHALMKITQGDNRAAISEAADNQDCIKNAAAVIIICAVYKRTTKKFGEKGVRYAHMEAGCAAQNIYLQSVSLGLGTVVVGGYNPGKLKKAVQLKGNEQPLYLMPVGRR
ncbi:MAG TPA: SagB/ThcOx family dehydrogenase [archaeon]|nr:SagB/ThcOx family dehydrogenase [archaeon]